MSAARCLAQEPSPILRAEAAQRACLAAIDDRFGWLKRLIAIHGGSLEDLRPHEKQLWYARQSVVASYNRIGQLPRPERRERAYERLALECTRI
jgi:hypothetical protein